MKERDELRRRHLVTLQLYSGVLIKAIKQFGEALEVNSATGPPVTLAELNVGIKSLGAEVRALGARGVKSLAADPVAIELAEQVPRLRLLKPTGKLHKSA